MIRLRWLESHEPVDQECAVVCFPPGGAGGLYFKDFEVPSASVLAVAYPGRDTRSDVEPARSIQQIGREVSSQIARSEFASLVLVGVSLGAFVAVDVARSLEAQDLPVAGVIVCASAAPGTETPVSEYSRLPDEEFMAAVAGLDSIAGSSILEPSFYEIALRRLRNDFWLCAKYSAKEPLKRTGIRVLTGRDDPGLPSRLAHSWCMLSPDVKVDQLSGDHGVFLQNLSRASLIARDLLNGAGKTSVESGAQRRAGKPLG